MLQQGQCGVGWDASFFSCRAVGGGMPGDVRTAFTARATLSSSSRLTIACMTAGSCKGSIMMLGRLKGGKCTASSERCSFPFKSIVCGLSARDTSVVLAALCGQGWGPSYFMWQKIPRMSTPPLGIIVVQCPLKAETR